MKSIFFFVPLFNFLLAACFGLLLRASFVYPSVNEGVTYLYVLHTHSHIALLGWLYMLVYVLFVHFFGIKNDKENRFYVRLFWVTEAAVLGMALTFPFQGYAAASITFSTLHIICSYFFGYHLWKNNSIANKQVRLLLKTALAFMFVSTLGVWFLGPAVGMMGKTSAFYQICIQFFLHFQFNGWFFTAFCALIFNWFLSSKCVKYFELFYTLWILSVVLTFGLILAWHLDIDWFYWINAIGVTSQLLAFVVLGKTFWHIIVKKRIGFTHEHIWMLLVLCCFIFRVLIQMVTASEVFASYAQSIRSWIVGFIHLNMLGILTGLGFWFMIKLQKITIDFNIKIGAVFLFSAFIMTELILFLQGLKIVTEKTILEDEVRLLFLFSIGFPLGILFIMNSFDKKKVYI